MSRGTASELLELGARMLGSKAHAIYRDSVELVELGLELRDTLDAVADRVRAAKRPVALATPSRTPEVLCGRCGAAWTAPHVCQRGAASSG